VPQQWVPTEPALIEGVERISIIIVHPQQRIGEVQQNSYIMEVNRRENRNCYSCRGFEHLVRNCRNRRIKNRIGEGRRLEYRGNGSDRQSNLKEKKDLIVFN